jgi:hypothetical protein
MSMDDKALREIARAFGPPSEARAAVDDEDRVVVRTDVWDWVLEPVAPRPPLTRAFSGTLYQAIPEVYTSGGAGLRSRWFAVAEGRVFTLDQRDDMRRFLERHVSRDDPYALATFLERGQGQGRQTHVYRADGTLERMLGVRDRQAVAELGLADPALVDGELRFDAWRLVMPDREEVIELERWTASLDAPDGPEWHSVRHPELLHLA